MFELNLGRQPLAANPTCQDLSPARLDPVAEGIGRRAGYFSSDTGTLKTAVFTTPFR